jgi:hypothetical protein
MASNAAHVGYDPLTEQAAALRASRVRCADDGCGSFVLPPSMRRGLQPRIAQPSQKI